MAEKIRVILPKKYDLVVGDTFQLFFRGVIEAPNPYVYSIVVLCEKGRPFPRYFEYTPEEPGEHKLTIRLYDAWRNLVGEGETLLVAKAAKEPVKCTTMLCMGDSLTAGGEWLAEFNRRITAEDGEPKGMGYKNAVKFVGSSCSRGVNHEAFGGWNWRSFMQANKPAMWVECPNNRTEADQHSIWQDENGALWQLETLQIDYLKFTRYLDHDATLPASGTLTHVKNASDTSPIHFKSAVEAMVSPLLDPETKEVDFASYAKRNNTDALDVVYIILGFNGLMSKEAMTLSRPEYCQFIVNGTKTLVDVIRKAFPDVQIKLCGCVCHSVNGGMGKSYGAELPLTDGYEITYFMKELDLAYQAWCLEDDYKDFMQYINMAGQFDWEYNMPSGMRKVNIRSNIMERIDHNGVHPSMDGYMQMADAIYRNFICSFCSE